MVYQPPRVPELIAEDPGPQAAYLLEDGFLEVPRGALETRLRSDRGQARMLSGTTGGISIGNAGTRGSFGR